MNLEDYYIKKEGNIEEWYSKETNDRRKRIRYWDNGPKQYEVYYTNGKLHRADGPARQLWYSDGTKDSDSYWLDGKWYSKEEYDKIIFKEKWKLI
jgi:hypothetical protein